MNSDPTASYDPSRCPLCGERNECASAADPDATDCWCVAEKFPSDLLQRVPAAAMGRACVCRRCVEDHRTASRE